jgi:hypothetical protein
MIATNDAIAVSGDTRQIHRSVRRIVRRTRGQTRGPITRLMSPSDLGELIKPFVFLDLAGFDGRFAPTPMESAGTRIRASPP